MQVAIVKYNTGNIRSVLNALHRCGVGHTITINNNKNFHTHTTLQYCTSDTVTFSRSTGVSTEDELTANTLGIPGLLYDYKKKTIYGGDSKKMAHKLYTFGPSRKTTPNNQHLD